MTDSERARLDREMLFEAAANSPVAWHPVAYELIAAGNLCFRRWVKHDLQTRRVFDRRPYGGVTHRTFLMLYAFALECLLKAAWLAQGNKAAQSGKRLSKKFMTHDLNRWWRDAKMLPLTPHESAALDLLNAYAVTGRYPVPAVVYEDSRLYNVMAAHPVIIAMLTAADDRVRELLPEFGRFQRRSKLSTLGFQRPLKVGPKKLKAGR